MDTEPIVHFDCMADSSDFENAFGDCGPELERKINIYVDGGFIEV